MVEINIHEAKTHLSKYLERVERGETIVVCRHNRPIAEIRPLSKSPSKPRKFGLDQGTVVIRPEFFAPLDEELLRDFSGEGE
jgi:prevent-host-death family protein